MLPLGSLTTLATTPYYLTVYAGFARYASSPKEREIISVRPSQQEGTRTNRSRLPNALANQVAAEGPTEASDARDPKLKDALSDRISMVFQEADVDGNGTLERKEFQEVGVDDFEVSSTATT